MLYTYIQSINIKIKLKSFSLSSSLPSSFSPYLPSLFFFNSNFSFFTLIILLINFDSFCIKSIPSNYLTLTHLNNYVVDAKYNTALNHDN